MNLMIDERDAEFLLRTLRNHLPELRGEVYKTENFAWRQELKLDEARLKSLIERLEEATKLAGTV